MKEEVGYIKEYTNTGDSFDYNTIELKKTSF